MHDHFRYDEFNVSADGRSVSFDYTIVRHGERHVLHEILEFPVALVSGAAQLQSLRALHLALGVSYYKTFLPDTIVQPYAMDGDEAEFWNDIWQNGLGEFLYVNKLPVDRLARFAPQDGQRFGGETNITTSGALLGIGGGKDSIVAGELLKDLNVPLTGFVMATGEQLGQAAHVADTMGLPLHAVKRQLDPKLIELQKQPGAYSGHVPISLIFGLVGTVLAIASGASYVVVANEASASIPRITWGDRAINHQWSKSFGFEQKLQRYIHRMITPDVTYFSAIRELTSIGVAKLFSRLPTYFEVFTSDNFVFRIDPSKRPNGRWSLESPKSLSSYLLLAPWLDDESLKRIFGMDLLNERELEQLFLELTGVSGEPPLDCVGTVDELVLSVNLLARDNRHTDSFLLQLARDNGVIEDKDWDAVLTQELALQADQALPQNLRDAVHDYLSEHLA